MCNCIQEQENLLKKELGAFAEIEQKTEGPGAKRLRLTVGYRPKDASGDYFRHWRYRVITPPFCPFCGKPYDNH